METTSVAVSNFGLIRGLTGTERTNSAFLKCSVGEMLGLDLRAAVHVNKTLTPDKINVGVRG